MISAFSNIEPVDPVVENQIGSAIVTITKNSGNVQESNFEPGSFQVTNTGDKRIAAIYIDVTEALFPDTVFDPQGLAGDTVARGLVFKDTGFSGAYEPAFNKNDPNVIEPFYGVGGASGYEGMLLTFDSTLNNGYEPGEVIEFGVDMDPNSIRGLPQQPVDIDGNDPRLQVNGKGWDIGGVSGAELLSAKVHILFTDGTEAVGEFISDGSQAGAVAVASQVGFNQTLNLSVNGLVEGGSGTYSENDIQVLVSGNPGDVARITLVKGFIQPFEYTDINGNLIDLSTSFINSPFPANNAIQVQTKDVVLDGTVQTITSLFDFGAPGGNVTGAPGSSLPRFLGDATLPLGFTASIIDNQGLPVSDVTEPIYLIHESMTSPPDDSPIDRDPLIPTLSINNVSVIEGDERVTFTVSLSSASASPVTVNYSTADETANSGSDYVATSGVV
ncbi:MAG: Calx-beta domain-containing protein, partial [Leptolyngbyaceae bacterium]|nr:Calx-beta domain-containing protein [Leptolyngbyaceae bacterium]